MDSSFIYQQVERNAMTPSQVLGKAKQMVRAIFVFGLHIVSLLALSHAVAAQMFNAPPLISNIIIGDVLEGQAIPVSLSVTPNQNLIGAINVYTRMEGTGTTTFSAAIPLQRVGSTTTYRGSISSRPYGGYTSRVVVAYRRKPISLISPLQTTSTDKVFFVSAGANCFTFDSAGDSQGWTGAPFRIAGTTSTFSSCVATPLQNNMSNWPFTVDTIAKGGLSDNTTIVDLCTPPTSQPDTAFWHTSYVSPDLTNRTEFQGATEIVVRVSGGGAAPSAARPFIQLQAERLTGEPRFPRQANGNPLFVQLGVNLAPTGTNPNGRLTNTFDQVRRWNVIRWQPTPALTDTVTRLRIAYVDTVGAIRIAASQSEISYELPKIDGVCAIR
jgi:hypothetical protein